MPHIIHNVNRDETKPNEERNDNTMNKTFEIKKYTYRVELDTMNAVKEFVAAATACDEKVTLKAGNVTVNAKSLIGVMLARKFSWENMTIESKRDLYYEFRKFIIDD